MKEGEGIKNGAIFSDSKKNPPLPNLKSLSYGSDTIST